MRAQLGVAQAGECRLRPAGRGPAGQERRQRGGAGEVGIGVERDVDAVGEAAVDQLDQLARAAPVDAEVHGRVGQVQGAAGAARDLHHLGVGVQRARAVGALVRRVVPAVGGDHLAERDQFGGAREHPRHVGQPGGEAESALAHAAVDLLAHGGQLGGGRGTVAGADDVHADGALREEVSRVRRCPAAVNLGEVVRDAAPGEVEAFGDAVPAGDLLAHDRQRFVGHRGVGEPVLTEDLRGDPLRHLREVLRVGEHGEIRVGVHIDETGGDRESVRLHHLGSGRGDAAADPGDAATGHQDIPRRAGPARAVEDERAPEEEVARARGGKHAGHDTAAANSRARSVIASHSAAAMADALTTLEPAVAASAPAAIQAPALPASSPPDGTKGMLGNGPRKSLR
ncbi:glutamate synthase subunit alpha [Leifsonia xyli subsp. cynodontis DSM 46306]|uniref:Uncharacterized protein n=1 Tax=Leifsonia xyli subsp. cynodontis DSM 46306 TaxID=1389489 RepID=U3PA70_LEIXC|nr:glutamate synthase subunit alpha [Leifsonia xyli subsp. cynodontis DSM 46306]